MTQPLYVQIIRPIIHKIELQLTNYMQTIAQDFERNIFLTGGSCSLSQIIPRMGNLHLKNQLQQKKNHTWRTMPYLRHKVGHSMGITPLNKKELAKIDMKASNTAYTSKIGLSREILSIMIHGPLEMCELSHHPSTSTQGYA